MMILMIMMMIVLTMWCEGAMKKNIQDAVTISVACLLYLRTWCSRFEYSFPSVLFCFVLGETRVEKSISVYLSKSRWQRRGKSPYQRTYIDLHDA